MEQFNCLIVDDEPIARDIILAYCKHLPYLNVVVSCGNAIEARVVLQNEKIQILFLDINMPVMDGLSFLKTLRNPPQIIFTTAYKEYALDAFDLAACDYLLKPFSLERFIIAVDKAVDKLRGASAAAPQATVTTGTENYMFIRTDGKIYKISFDDILYGEANGNYTKIVMKHSTIMPAMTFSSFEELLPGSIFLRVHRSFIINKSKIAHIEGNRVFINNTEIPIGTNYKEEFIKQLGL